MTAQGGPAPDLLNLTASVPPLNVGLRATIVYNGPGSWKNDALWDEYVVTIQNDGDAELSVTGAALVDFGGARCAPGDDPWELEKDSQTLEQRYRRAGVAFARGAVPRALVTGAAMATAASGGVIAGGVAAVAVVSVVALPVYYVVVLKENHRNKLAVNDEFRQRRIALPVTLTPGEVRTGSLFFPMVPNPQSLVVRWSDSVSPGELVLSLEALHGLHVTGQASKGSDARGQSGSKPESSGCRVDSLMGGVVAPSNTGRS
jgi:hypothetical protein